MRGADTDINKHTDTVPVIKKRDPGFTELPPLPITSSPLFFTTSVTTSPFYVSRKADNNDMR